MSEFKESVISYSKKENLRPGEWEMYQYTHLIAEAKSKFSPNLKPYAATHDIIDTVEAFHQLSFNYFTIPPVKIKTKPVLFILKRRENYKELLQISQESGENDYGEENNMSDEERLKAAEKMESRDFIEEAASPENEESTGYSEEETEEASEQYSEEKQSDTSKSEDTSLADENIEASIERKAEKFEEIDEPTVDKSGIADETEGKVRIIKRQKTETKTEEKILPKLLKKSKPLDDEEVIRGLKTDRNLEEEGLKSKKFKTKEDLTVPKPPKKLSLVEESGEVIIEKPLKKSKVEIKSFREIDRDEEEFTTMEEEIKPKRPVVYKKSKLEVKTEEKIVPVPLKKLDLVEEPEEDSMEKPMKKTKFEDERITAKLLKKMEDEERFDSVEEQNIQSRAREVKSEDGSKRQKLEIKSEEKIIPKLLKRKGEESIKDFNKPNLKPALKQVKQVTSLALPKKGAESRQNVRQNIRKIIQTFKRKHIDEEFSEQPKEGLHAKETIKKIIEEERSKQEREEINKIQQQIMDIIENNPNIINKELIKSKLQDTIITELANAIDHKIQDTEVKIKKTEDAKKPREFTRKFPEVVKKPLEAEKPSPLKDLKDELFKETPISKMSMEEYGKSDEDYEPGEIDGAINLYGSPQSVSDFKSDEDVAKPSKPDEEHILEEEKLAFIKRFKKANEKLDNILTIIDEIVDTIEVTDEDDEDSFR